ncbi:MAG: translation initiation factor IF-3 [Phycisphaerales bacterium]|nr:translation initiation factor IF-3 [Phycisphaerales bacterium]
MQAGDRIERAAAGADRPVDRGRINGFFGGTTAIAKLTRINEQIRISPVRLIDHEGNQRGVVPTAEAQGMAREAGLDLVEVSPNERPPVCRIMDYGKHKYDQKKRQKQQHHHENVMKEIRLRPKTDDHDRKIKIDKASEFVKAGHKVQFTMLFRGRERAHQDLAMLSFNEILVFFGEAVKVERPVKMEGRRMTMVVAPAKK